MANFLSKQHDLKLIVSESKTKYNALNETHNDKVLSDHFNLLKKEHKTFFGDLQWPKNINLLEIDRGGINSKLVEKKIINSNVDGIAVFGPGILKKNIYSICEGKVINAHQGMSPFYRGSATNFWPFVNKEIQFVGVTMHYIDKGIDTGEIICHGQPEIDIDDNMHTIGCKVILQTAKLFVKIFNMIETGIRPFGFQQWSKGRLYQRKDFNSKAVTEAYVNIKNGLIAEYLNKKNKGDFNIQTISIK